MSLQLKTGQIELRFKPQTNVYGYIKRSTQLLYFYVAIIATLKV